MVTVEGLAEYLRLYKDEVDSTLDLCIKAAKSKAKAAGIPEFKNNAQYDIFIYALAGYLYDNRNLTLSSYNKNDETSKRMINSFILELRYADEDTEKISDNNSESKQEIENQLNGGDINESK